MWRASCAVRPKLFVDMRNHIPEDLIERLYFYKQVDVIRVAPTDTSTNITSYFYVCQLPLESIIQLETLKAFGFPGKERKSYLKGIMLLRSAVDRTNNLCVTPQGYLHLVLDKESYEQFGVVGTKLKGKMEYFHVQVDLHRLVSSKGSLRSRLEWCLKKSSNPVDLAISCTIPLEQVPLQGLQSYRKISIEPTTLWMEEKRVPFIDEWLVRLSTYITQGEAALQESAATMPSDIEFIVQWIGALVTQCPGLMMDMQSELLCDYICPHIEEMYPLGFRTDAKDWTVETIQHQQWQGFIGCDMIKSICESLQREVQQNIVKWAVISCQSFQDAPVVYHNKIIRAAAPAMEHSCGWIGIVSSTAGSEGKPMKTTTTTTLWVCIPTTWNKPPSVIKRSMKKDKRPFRTAATLQSETQQQRLGFLGCGHMAKAIIRGFIVAGIPSDLIYATTKTPSSAQKAKQLGVGHIASDNQSLVSSCDMVFLAVKPQSLDQVLKQLKENVDTKVLSEKLFISIAAGKTCDQIAAQLGASHPRVMRVMPNLPVAVGHLAGAYCAGANVQEKDIERVVQLFSLVGGVLEPVTEECMEAVTALCGSGPAFVYMFLEALADGAVRQGLDRKVANQLALEMVYGACKLAKNDNLHFAQLRNQVESPAGTTVYGTSALENGQFRKAVINAIQEAVLRAKQL